MSAVVYWRNNFKEAQEEAKKAGLPLLLEFHLEG
jgi:hypothetical protein